MNILKLRPPMPFGEAEAELAVATLDAVLRDPA
jgi:4-aminobutyrate aminotransferase-like enzyme